MRFPCCYLYTLYIVIRLKCQVLFNTFNDDFLCQVILFLVNLYILYSRCILCCQVKRAPKRPFIFLYQICLLVYFLTRSYVNSSIFITPFPFQISFPNSIVPTISSSLIQPAETISSSNSFTFKEISNAPV